jgi:Mg-chelatase subunit ChlD
MLGRERERLPPNAARYARALDELYGHGRGEGQRGLGGGGGREAPFPTVREWSEELEGLFGAVVREEVLGHAAAAGRASAALALDPDSVTPSVELLERVLSLKGGLAERDLERLRRLVRRVVDALVEALAQRVRPALSGLVTPRPTRRPTGPLDLRRTLAQNLRTARRTPGGELAVVAERLSFKSRQKRSLDWHLVLVVDVSGSMEASVIYSAMMAAILDALPALTVRFVAFNTEVMDLSERVDDPLGLLLEISVGGGTDIGRGLRYARGLLRVPQRSIVVVVSDFEEGASVPGLLAEARALVESGARVLGLAALDDRAAPRYHQAIAGMLADAGVRVAALTPLELARWVAEQVR